MKLLRTGLAAVALALSFSGASQAAPVFGAGTNLVKYINYENEYRPTGNCPFIPSGCLAGIATDPPGYTRINPATPGNTLPGDLFIGILSLTSIFNGITQIFAGTPGNFFTGYFVQEVKTVMVGPGLNPTVTLTLGTGVDPFGKLTAGSMFDLYSSTPLFTLGAGGGTNVMPDILNAISGTLWASLVPSGATAADGYAYTVTNTGVINTSNTNSFAGLGFLGAPGPGYNAGALDLINDPGEANVGGTTASLICAPGDIGVRSCTPFTAESKIQPTTLGVFGVSNPWMFESQDPVLLSKIPEPGSVALIGIALAGLGVVRRRKSA